MLDESDHAMLNNRLADISTSIDGVEENMPYIDGDDVTRIANALESIQQILCAAFNIEETENGYTKKGTNQNG